MCSLAGTWRANGLVGGLQKKVGTAGSICFQIVGCLTLLFKKPLPMESHFEPSCAMASQVVPLVRSLLSRLILFGCCYALILSSHVLAGIPCFGCPFCLLDIAGFQLEISFVQRPSWCLAIILACFQKILLCLRIHDVIPLASHLPCVLLTHGSSSSSGSSFGTSTKEGCCPRRGCFLLARWGSCGVGFNRVILRFTVGVVGVRCRRYRGSWLLIVFVACFF